jgi:nucleotide-binding universal stress UspA family protein
MTGHGSHRPLVVLGDDGQQASDVAWAWLISHRWEGWDLQTVTVRWSGLAGGTDLKPTRVVPRRPPLEAALSAWDHLEVAGDPRVVLLERSDAGLMVLGHHRRGHLAGLWEGSTAEWLLVHPPAPLLLARHGHATRTVAVCVDGGPHARRALHAFAALPWSADAAVTLVSVDDGATDVEGSLQEAAAALPGGIPAPAVARLQGQARRALGDFVRAEQVDLVVMGTRGLTGLARLQVGSSVGALVKQGTANLLIAHAPGSQRVAAG